MSKRKVGTLLEVTFWDHCTRPGTDLMAEPIEFKTTGKYLREDKLYIVLGNWLETNGTIDNNTELDFILKSCITNVRVLR